VRQGQALQLEKMASSILLVEQNARLALQFGERGCAIETGRLVMAGASRASLENPDVKKAYLGG